MSNPSPPEPRHFVLDQNFPWQLVQLPWPGSMRVTPLRALDGRLTAGYQDWQVLLALHQRGDVHGFVTNDDGILYSPREMVVLSRTRLALVVTRGVGHDAIRATGLVMAHLTRIGPALTGQPTVFVLRPLPLRPVAAGQQINTVARHRSIPPQQLISEELHQIGDLGQPVLD